VIRYFLALAFIGVLIGLSASAIFVGSVVALIKIGLIGG
jgi:hypothetical protein